MWVKSTLERAGVCVRGGCMHDHVFRQIPFIIIFSYVSLNKYGCVVF